MTDDLRNQLAQFFASHTYIAECHVIADALLARFAVAGPLPEPDTDYQYPGGRWSVNHNDPTVFLSSEGQIDFSSGYWNTRKGDDPRPFAAALIAAWRKAQEQSHARWEAGHGKR